MKNKFYTLKPFLLLGMVSITSGMEYDENKNNIENQDNDVIFKQNNNCNNSFELLSGNIEKDVNIQNNVSEDISNNYNSKETIINSEDCKCEKNNSGQKKLPLARLNDWKDGTDLNGWAKNAQSHSTKSRNPGLCPGKLEENVLNVNFDAKKDEGEGVKIKCSTDLSVCLEACGERIETFNNEKAKTDVEKLHEQMGLRNLGDGKRTKIDNNPVFKRIMLEIEKVRSEKGRLKIGDEVVDLSVGANPEYYEEAMRLDKEVNPLGYFKVGNTGELDKDTLKIVNSWRSIGANLTEAFYYTTYALAKYGTVEPIDMNNDPGCTSVSIRNQVIIADLLNYIVKRPEIKNEKDPTRFRAYLAGQLDLIATIVSMLEANDVIGRTELPEPNQIWSVNIEDTVQECVFKLMEKLFPGSDDGTEEQSEIIREFRDDWNKKILALNKWWEVIWDVRNCFAIAKEWREAFNEYILIEQEGQALTGYVEDACRPVNRRAKMLTELGKISKNNLFDCLILHSLDLSEKICRWEESTSREIEDYHQKFIEKNASEAEAKEMSDIYAAKRGVANAACELQINLMKLEKKLNDSHKENKGKEYPKIDPSDQPRKNPSCYWWTLGVSFASIIKENPGLISDSSNVSTGLCDNDKILVNPMNYGLLLATQLESATLDTTSKIDKITCDYRKIDGQNKVISAANIWRNVIIDKLVVEEQSQEIKDAVRNLIVGETKLARVKDCWRCGGVKTMLAYSELYVNEFYDNDYCLKNCSIDEVQLELVSGQKGESGDPICNQCNVSTDKNKTVKILVNDWMVKYATDLNEEEFKTINSNEYPEFYFKDGKIITTPQKLCQKKKKNLKINGIPLELIAENNRFKTQIASNPTLDKLCFVVATGPYTIVVPLDDEDSLDGNIITLTGSQQGSIDIRDCIVLEPGTNVKIKPEVKKFFDLLDKAKFERNKKMEEKPDEEIEEIKSDLKIKLGENKEVNLSTIDSIVEVSNYLWSDIENSNEVKDGIDISSAVDDARESLVYILPEFVENLESDVEQLKEAKKNISKKYSDQLKKIKEEYEFPSYYLISSSSQMDNENFNTKNDWTKGLSKGVINLLKYRWWSKNKEVIRAGAKTGSSASGLSVKNIQNLVSENIISGYSSESFINNQGNDDVRSINYYVYNKDAFKKIEIDRNIGKMIKDGSNDVSLKNSVWIGIDGNRFVSIKNGFVEAEKNNDSGKTWWKKLSEQEENQDLAEISILTKNDNNEINSFASIIKEALDEQKTIKSQNKNMNLRILENPEIIESEKLKHSYKESDNKNSDLNDSMSQKENEYSGKNNDSIDNKGDNSKIYNIEEDKVLSLEKAKSAVNSGLAVVTFFPKDNNKQTKTDLLIYNADELGKFITNNKKLAVNVGDVMEEISIGDSIVVGTYTGGFKAIIASINQNAEKQLSIEQKRNLAKILQDYSALINSSIRAEKKLLVEKEVYNVAKNLYKEKIKSELKAGVIELEIEYKSENDNGENIYDDLLIVNKNKIENLSEKENLNELINETIEPEFNAENAENKRVYLTFGEKEFNIVAENISDQSEISDPKLLDQILNDLKYRGREGCKIVTMKRCQIGEEYGKIADQIVGGETKIENVDDFKIEKRDETGDNQEIDGFECNQKFNESKSKAPQFVANESKNNLKKESGDVNQNLKNEIEDTRNNKLMLPEQPK